MLHPDYHDPAVRQPWRGSCERGAAERRQAADADEFQARTCGSGGQHREPATSACIRPPGNRGSYCRRDRPVSATAPSGPVL